MYYPNKYVLYNAPPHFIKISVSKVFNTFNMFIGQILMSLKICDHIKFSITTLYIYILNPFDLLPPRS